ncbi:MAG: NAD(P)-dependent oxidoreductase [Armatimonadetes bacterium]|nr:NAD(P)-dependent oxidoreductase [Armatimonadota bacterium]MDW8121371.1 NAD(P)-dependent oxidoreductase [Armatimonadota bacterium]
MKVLVTGAAGQVGSRLTRQLVAKNHQVVAAILPNDPLAGRLTGLPVDIREGNLLDWSFVQSVVGEVDAVIHTANFVSSTLEAFQNNLMNTFYLVHAAAQRSSAIHRFVHISSSAVYPNDSHLLAPCYHPVDEAHPKRPVGVYAIGKWAGERIVWDVAQSTNLKVTVIRPTAILSEDKILTRWTTGFVAALLRAGWQHPKSEIHHPEGDQLAERLLQEQGSDRLCAVTDTNGRPWSQQVVDARDVARICAVSLEHPSADGEAFNVSGPGPLPFPEACRLIANLTGESVLSYETPVRWVFDLDNTKARSLIGFQPEWSIPLMIRSALLSRKTGREPFTPEETEQEV